MRSLFAALMIFAPIACWASCPSGQAKDEAALVQIEQTWAKALEQHDAAAVGCILANEFEDADPNVLCIAEPKRWRMSCTGGRPAIS